MDFREWFWRSPMYEFWFPFLYGGIGFGLSAKFLGDCTAVNFVIMAFMGALGFWMGRMLSKWQIEYFDKLYGRPPRERTDGKDWY